MVAGCGRIYNHRRRALRLVDRKAARSVVQRRGRGRDHAQNDAATSCPPKGEWERGVSISSRAGRHALERATKAPSRPNSPLASLALAGGVADENAARDSPHWPRASRLSQTSFPG